jgi:hypothetical protein
MSARRHVPLASLLVLLLALPASAKPALPALPSLPIPLPGARPAVDANAVFPAGLLELLPANGLIADGGTAAELRLLALKPDGAPLTGLAGAVPTSTAGTAGPLRELGGGLYAFPFTPSRADAPGAVPIALKYKLADKSVVQGSWSVAVAPGPREVLTLAASPPTVLLGQDKSGSLQLKLESSDPLGVATARLSTRSSLGTVGPVTALGSGQFTALYTPPADVTQPGVALITAADRRDPARAYAVAAVPLHGKQELSLTPGKGTRVLVRLGGRDFGPVAADSSGKARVSVVVPPGVSEATVVTMGADGSTKEAALPLKVAEKRRLAWVPVAATVPADARQRVPVRVFVVTPEGRPEENAQLALTASAGAVSSPRHEGGGVYVAEWIPSEGNGAGKVTLSASLTGAGAAQLDTLQVDVAPVRVGAVMLGGSAVAAGPGNAFSVTASVLSPGGAPLPGRVLHVTANGARSAPAKDEKGGRYTIPLVSTGSGPIDVFVRASTPSAGNPLDRLVLVSDRFRVAPDGLSSVPITVFALDAWGHPVPDVTFDLVVSAGDGALPGTATTGADGVAQLYYTAGRANGLVRIDARYGPYVASTGIVQAPDSVAVPDWQPGGTSAATAEASALRDADGATTLERAQ